VNEWIVELKFKFEIWRSRGECKEGNLPMSEKVILDIERTPSRALIGGACCSCGSGPPLTQCNTKGAHRARKPMFTVPTVPPHKNTSSRTYPECAEMKGRAHCATTIVAFPTPTPLPLLRLPPPTCLHRHLLKVISK
jgi:hypothetical protein